MCKVDKRDSRKRKGTTSDATDCWKMKFTRRIHFFSHGNHNYLKIFIVKSKSFTNRI